MFPGTSFHPYSRRQYQQNFQNCPQYFPQNSFLQFHPPQYSMNYYSDPYPPPYYLYPQHQNASLIQIPSVHSPQIRTGHPSQTHSIPQLRSIEIIARAPNTNLASISNSQTNSLVQNVNELLQHTLQTQQAQAEQTPQEERSTGVSLENLLDTTELFICQTDTTCSICQMSMHSKPSRCLRCNHSFHAQCIDRWFCSHSSCPLCRIDVNPQNDTTVQNDPQHDPNPPTQVSH